MADHESGPLNAQQLLEHYQPSEAPWWVTAMKTWGVGAGIGIFLVWFMATVVLARLDTVQSTLSNHVLATQLDQTEIRYLLRSICLNTADTEAERAGCVLPGQAR